MDTQPVAKKYYAAQRLLRANEMKIVIDSGSRRIELPLSNVKEDNALGYIPVYESLEDLKRDYPNADYFTIEISETEKGGDHEG